MVKKYKDDSSDYTRLYSFCLWLRKFPPFNWIYWRWWHFTEWISVTIFKARHGYDYRDVWDMGTALNNWMIPRLRQYIRDLNGCPGLYGLSEEEIERLETSREFHTVTPDHELWKKDLERALKFFEDAAWMEEHEHELANQGVEVWKKRHDELKKEQQEVFNWLGKWYGAIWN